MAAFTALYDACVFYPAPLRDLLMHLAGAGLFRARWTEAIHEEWIRNVLKNRPDLRRAQRQNLTNPPKTAAELLDTLDAQHLAGTVAQLRGLAASL